jgi:hypothetical protein
VAVDVHVVSQSDDDLLDLLGELTGRGENESLRLAEGHVDLMVPVRFEQRRKAG